MTPLLVVGLLAASALAAPNTGYSSGPSYGGQGGGYGDGGYGGGFPRFSREELLNLEDFIASVAAERNDLRARLDALKDNEGDLQDKLNDIIYKLNDRTNNININGQNARIRQIANRIRALLIQAGDLEARLAGEVEISDRLDALIIPNNARIDGLISSNTRQDGLLAQANVFLNEAKDKLDEKLDAASSRTQDDIEEVSDNTQATADLVNSRQCFVDFVGVEIGPDGTGQAAVYFPNDFFTGEDIPTVFCGIQGFVSDINLDASQKVSPPKGGYGYDGSYGYGYAVDERQNLAVAINCQGFQDRVDVSAVDQSRGQGNAVVKVYVEVKACSFAAQAGFLH